MPSETEEIVTKPDSDEKRKWPALPALLIFMAMVFLPRFLVVYDLDIGLKFPIRLPYNLPDFYQGNMTLAGIAFLILYGFLVQYLSNVVSARHQLRLQTAAFWIPVMIGSLLYFPIVFRSLLIYFTLHCVSEYHQILSHVYASSFPIEQPEAEPKLNPKSQNASINTKPPTACSTIAQQQAPARPHPQWPLAAAAAVVSATTLFGGVARSGAALCAAAALLALRPPPAAAAASSSSPAPGIAAADGVRRRRRAGLLLDVFGLVYVAWCLGLAGVVLDHPHGQVMGN
jgi:hypothetical protein